MTRIVIEPAGVRRAATALRDVAVEHRRSAARLAGDGLPSMPPELAARYAARIRGLVDALDALAGDLVRAGAGLESRARLAEAGQGAGAPARAVPLPAPPVVLAPRAPSIPRVGRPRGGAAAARLVHDLGGGGTAAPPHPGSAAPAHPGAGASRQDAACWLAAQSRAAGAPAELLVMAALTESGGRNLPYGDADSVGYFQIRPSTNTVPAGFGVPPGSAKPGEWWVEHPDAQAAWARSAIERTLGGARDADLDDPGALGAWCQALEQSGDPERYREHFDAARALVDRCGESRTPAPAAGGLPRRVLATAAGELGVHEAGDNTGPRVSVYQERTGAGHAPWCASFVTWALERSGHSMPEGNWAAVANWVGAARQGADGLQIVSAADARPGDLVAYDWGFGDDFGADGHIGLLSSEVRDGGFAAIEGNYHDAVGRTSRTLGQANIVFIRVGA